MEPIHNWQSPCLSLGGGHLPRTPSSVILEEEVGLRAALLVSLFLEKQVTLPGYIRGFLLSLLNLPPI